METLRIHLFGTLEIYADGRLVPPFPTQKARLLFCYLALNRRRVLPRDLLVGTFWGDHPEAVARKNLCTALWRIRSTLAAGGAAAARLAVEGDGVRLEADSGTWVDVDEFAALHASLGGSAGAELSPVQAAAVRKMMELYRSDVLADLYESWCDSVRERMKLYLLEALERLARHHAAHGEWIQALRTGSEILRVDPLREHVHRDLMRYCCAMGDRAAALRYFTQFQALLRRELDIEPMTETLMLRDEILGMHPRAPAPEIPARTAALLLADLDTAAGCIAQARRTLEVGAGVCATSAAES